MEPALNRALMTPSLESAARTGAGCEPAHFSQRDHILEHLQAGAEITPMLALQLYGCLALSQRIGELKRLGHDIETVMTRQGRKQFATYRLRGQLELS